MAQPDQKSCGGVLVVVVVVAAALLVEAQALAWVHVAIACAGLHDASCPCCFLLLLLWRGLLVDLKSASLCWSLRLHCILVVAEVSCHAHGSSIVVKGLKQQCKLCWQSRLKI